MNILHMKGIGVIFFYLIITPYLLLPCNSQNDKLLPWKCCGNLNEMKNFEDLDDKCTLLGECEDVERNILTTAQFEKRKGHSSELASILNARKQKAVAKNLGSCSCETNHTVLNLGKLYLPRYLPTRVCKPGSCLDGLHRCHPKTFSIPVLKKKQMEDVDRNDLDLLSFPKSLQHAYVEEDITVVVDCECSL